MTEQKKYQSNPLHWRFWVTGLIPGKTYPTPISFVLFALVLSVGLFGHR